MRSYLKSKYKAHLAHYRLAKKLIPNQSQTLSKAPMQFVLGRMPLFSQRARGAYIWDISGNKYLDYMGALGPILLGYNDKTTNSAIKKQLKNGIIFSQPHPLEVRVAKLLTEIIPSAEMVRFAKNGSDATAGAVRIARAYTGRDLIFYCGYHGAQDWYVVTTERNAGVPKILKRLIYGFEYNNIDSLKKLFEKHRGKAAAVIMEPAYYHYPKKDFLEEVKNLAHKNGALLIFDEIITGFRWDLGGAQKYFGVIPDLACFGKSMANGMPISCIVGKRHIMKKCENVFFSMTYGGECLSLAAAEAVITKLKNEPDILRHIWTVGTLLQSGIKNKVKKYGLETHIECVGFPPRPVMHFYDGAGAEWPELKTLFQQHIIDQGILYTVYWNITYAHKRRHIDFTLGAVDKALRLMKDAVESGRVTSRVGQAVKSVFVMHAASKKTY